MNQFAPIYLVHSRQLLPACNREATKWSAIKVCCQIISHVFQVLATARAVLSAMFGPSISDLLDLSIFKYNHHNFIVMNLWKIANYTLNSKFYSWYISLLFTTSSVEYWKNGKRKKRKSLVKSVLFWYFCFEKYWWGKRFCDLFWNREF